MKYTFGIIHRYRGSSQTDWYSGLKTLLEADGHKVIIPDLPGDDKPRAVQWLPLLDRQFSDADNLVLIGHSIGTRGALLYLEKYRKPTKLLFMVGALSNDMANAERLGGEAADFYTHKINPDGINEVAEKIVMVHSRDDPHVSYPGQAIVLADELGAELLAYEDKGHFLGPQHSELIYSLLNQYLVQANE